MEKIKLSKSENGVAYYYGRPVSQYAIDNGRLDYGSLAHSVGSMVLCNEIANKFCEEWTLHNGDDKTYHDQDGNELESDNDENFYDYQHNEYYQYYIISNPSLLENTDETVYYIESLDIYVWAISHCGTSWDYVLTDIEIELI